MENPRGKERGGYLTTARRKTLQRENGTFLLRRWKDLPVFLLGEGVLPLICKPEYTHHPPQPVPFLTFSSSAMASRWSLDWEGALPPE